MTSIAILIPCHIHYEEQIKIVDNCIYSLVKQTKLPNSIYMSVSFENEIYKKDFVKNILQKYGKYTQPKISFKFSNKKKYQMEHLFNIYTNIETNKYDLFMFCDDDDTYHNERIETFINAFIWGKNQYPESFGGVREHFKSDINPELETPEYWAYGISPNVMAEFFSLFNNINYNLLQHNFGDMYLRHYLRKNKKYVYWVALIEDKPRLYNYNINNPNSICGKIEQGLGNIYDKILLKVLACRSDSELTTIINEFNDKEIEFTCKYIYKFCKLLYK